jgi:hypothetical protein
VVSKAKVDQDSRDRAHLVDASRESPDVCTRGIESGNGAVVIRHKTMTQPSPKVLGSDDGTVVVDATNERPGRESDSRTLDV